MASELYSPTGQGPYPTKSAASGAVTSGTGSPSTTPSVNTIYIQLPGPNYGLWAYDTSSGWENLITHGP